jgi:hypothetical protein
MEGRHQCLEEHRDDFRNGRTSFPQTPTNTAVGGRGGGTIEWFDKTRYLGVTLDKRLTWSAHFDQVRMKTAQVKGVLGPLLDSSGLPVRNGVLLLVEAAHPPYDGLRVFAARTHTGRVPGCRCTLVHWQ